MSSLLFVLFSLFVFLISFFIIFINKKKYNRSSKTKIFAPLIPSSKEQEYSPDINTDNWDLHKNRLIKFGRSQYKGLTFFASSKDGIYYLSEEGTKIYV